MRLPLRAYGGNGTGGRHGGKATLTAHVEGSGVCPTGSATVAGDFTMAGKKTRSQIRLAPTPEFPFPVDLRISGNHASGSSTLTPGENYTITYDFTADCQNCEEDVG